MDIKIYVGNIPFTVTESDINDLFSTFGLVTEVRLIRGQVPGQLHGFGFVTMPNHEELILAVKELQGKVFHGQVLNVNKATERPDTQ